MNHDVTARVDTQFLCSFPVTVVWIRYMQRAMESAVFLSTINDVKAFRGSVVALTFLGLKSSSANRDVVGANSSVPSLQQ